MEYYNLDVIISVGYRTNSSKAIKFRQWATSILRSYIQNGYVINSDKITNERFLILDSMTVYHLGASLKDLGKKWFLKESASTRLFLR